MSPEDPWLRYSPVFIQECPTCHVIHENRRGWDEYCENHTPYSERVGRVGSCGINTVGGLLD
jgi:hypothetical protein